MDTNTLHILSAGADVNPPLYFNNPFSYTPHPLCRMAAEEVRTCLGNHPEWTDELRRGKMFGVLVVERLVHTSSDKHHYAYLASFSGQLNGESIIDGFVPPVFDVNQSDFFMCEMHKIETMDDRSERKYRSEALQDWLFKQYSCFNAFGESKTIFDIFIDFYRKRMIRQENYEKNATSHHIPSGTGDCCAPKLLQYAYKNGLKPLCIAEFWVQTEKTTVSGDKRREVLLGLSEIRHDGHFYPACGRKCSPLLDFMLQGLEVETDNTDRQAANLMEKVQIIYEDDVVIVIDKPSGLLSVPGRTSEKSVADWLRDFHHLEDFWFVHRLDQDTSGLLVIAKNEAIYKELQQQFIRHEVKKTYEAWLDGHVVGEEGVVKLRMRPDLSDPPRQIVDHEHGKMAVTRWKVLERTNGMTHVALFPDTGRTHQLRVHCAHPLGLNAPIHGDRLYAVTPSNDRLALFATSLEINLKQQTKRFNITPITFG